jgi:poly-gamma-glutamate capsule biosynthesis protein CapA/YwtB (metallophosphatase superfamily)
MARRPTNGSTRSVLLVVLLMLCAGGAAAQEVPVDTASPPVPPNPSVPTPALRSARLVFAGDVLPHLSVVRVACKPGKPCDFGRLLAPTNAVVAAADLAVCHLEVPIVRRGQLITGYPTFGSPPALAPALREAGWDHCSTASNHTIDRGVAGIDSTLDALDAASITHSGSARSREESRTVVVREVNGIRIALLSATFGLNGLRLPEGQGWRVKRIDVEALIGVARAAKQAGVPVVVVSLHWGNEYQHRPTNEQRRIARALMNSGQVDLIVGHHAHVVQPIEQVRGKWVVFGLGNHLSGQVPLGPKLATQDGMIVEVGLSEQPDGGFRVATPIVHATWNNPSDKRVYLTELLPTVAAANASQRRTMLIARPSANPTP